MLRKELGEIVHRIHLGGAQEVKDPHSREFIKKPLKAFMVDQSVLMLERGQIRIPCREVDETLARQMTNYQVVKYSAKTGEPTFTDQDEHALDAFNFTLLAFINELPDLAATVINKEAARSIGVIKNTAPNPFKAAEQKQNKETSPLRQKEKKKVNFTTASFQKKRSSGIGWGSRGGFGSKQPSRGGW